MGGVKYLAVLFISGVKMEREIGGPIRVHSDMISHKAMLSVTSLFQPSSMVMSFEERLKVELLLFPIKRSQLRQFWHLERRSRHETQRQSPDMLERFYLLAGSLGILLEKPEEVVYCPLT